MGPLVDETAVTAVLDFQDELHGAGGRVLVQATRMAGEGHFVTPGVVEVDRFSLEGDHEIFGPFVQIAVVDGVEEAIEQANTTRYGLAASVFTRDDDRFERCFHAIRAGCINRNTGTAGASGKLPFGGVGRSGNHRPAGAFAADFCAYPVASMVETGEQVVVPAGMQMPP
jgi:succinylglutamic semialdehyde dehydrogenase